MLIYLPEKTGNEREAASCADGSGDAVRYAPFGEENLEKFFGKEERWSYFLRVRRMGFPKMRGLFLEMQDRHGGNMDNLTKRISEAHRRLARGVKTQWMLTEEGALCTIRTGRIVADYGGCLGRRVTENTILI